MTTIVIAAAVAVVAAVAALAAVAIANDNNCYCQ